NEWAVDDYAVDTSSGIKGRINPESRLLLVNARGSRTVYNGCTDCVGTCLHRESEAACIAHINFRAVDGDVDGTTSQAAANTELVFRIDWERVLDQHAAASPQRQTFDVTLLRKSTWRVVGHLARNQRAVADCAAADLHCGGNVALNERGRCSECIGDVVKTFRRIVRRQQGRNVHIEPKQVSDNVRIFRPIQPMQRGGSR